MRYRLPDARRRMLVYLVLIAMITTVLFPVAQAIIALIPGRMPFGWHTVLGVSYGVSTLLLYAMVIWRPLPFMFIRRAWNDMWFIAIAVASFLLTISHLATQ